MVKNTTILHKLDGSSSPSALLPSLETEQQVLCLVKPQGKKSRFWVHFSEYDAEAHPDKVKYARCNLCGRDISVKQGTGGLKNHLKFKHPNENALLFMHSDEIGRENAEAGASTVDANALGATPSAAAATDAATPAKKKIKISLQDITSRMDMEKRAKQKQDLEMWSTVRREIKELKKELASEEDEQDRRDLERDIKNLKKMKAGLDEQLGFCSGSAEAMV
eukprot:CAMPEP_0201686698 /NCGR_PEP_ID=MMETSP0578-20130828/1045_1 /ASSEMBLY_ACC=CAM_ASM_000663 /TAXON_ID=267565 /ORGANISM="Skeletonema grethea, Strain CCMP 1804" /LENGTH=220 /DNA_ID=CAMNT_0048170783 /DNA_START=83 /DNA_END=745 /DNA_ORIENTATION=+